MGNWLKRFLSVALVLLMVLSYMPTSTLVQATGNAQIVNVATGAELKDAIAKANAGSTIVLSDHVTVDSTIEIKENITLDLNNFTVTGTANRLFRITASKQVKIINGTIVNTAKDGRCVETRTGGIDLVLEGVTLKAEKGASQPLTVGGSGTDIQIVIADSTISAGDGYAITTFNPVEMKIENSNVSGFGVLNIKGASGSVGSVGSVFDIINSTLASFNHNSGDANSFSTVMVEDKNITINIDANSTVSAAYEDSAQVNFAIGNSVVTNIVTGLQLNIANGAKLQGKYLLSLYYNQSISGNTITLPDSFADALTAEGFLYNKNEDSTVTVTGLVESLGSINDTKKEEVVGGLVDKIVTQTPGNEIPDEEMTEIKKAVDEVVDDIFGNNNIVKDKEYKPVEEHEDIAHLEVTLDGVNVELLDGEDGKKVAIVTEITYNVSPLTVDGNKVATPEKPITFRLPVPSSISGNHLEVYHENECLGLYAILGEGTNRYVEISSDTFSAYTLKQSSAVAKINGVGYETLEAALAAATEGDVIMLLKDISLDGELFIDIQITLDLNGHNLDGHIYHGVVHEPDCVNDGYTEYICIDCGMAFADDETAALGHADDDCDRVCDRCDTSLRTAQTDLEDSLQDLSSSMESAFQVTMRLLQVLLQLPKTIFSAFNGLLR